MDDLFRWMQPLPTFPTPTNSHILTKLWRVKTFIFLIKGERKILKLGDFLKLTPSIWQSYQEKLRGI